MDKQALFDALLRKLDAEAEEMTTIAEKRADDAAKQEGRMVSRYDTMRIEGSWMADAHNRRAAELHNNVSRLRSYAMPPAQSEVCVGSLVSLYSPRGTNRYLVLLVAGGAEIPDGDDVVMVMTPQAPLGTEIMGKRRGYQFDFRNTKYQISAIE